MITNVMERLIDFTRTSGGGYFGPDGLFRFTPASRNLLTYTQELDNGAWVKSNVVVTANVVAAPDGTLTGDKAIEDATNNVHRVNATYAFPSVAPHTLSVYAKAAERSWLRVNNGSDNLSAFFNLSTGVVGTTTAGVTASITAVGNGWYRCAIVFTPASAAAKSMAFNVSNADNVTSYLGDGTSGIYLWGAQLELASAATDYTRNFGGLFPPRFDYDPVTLAPRGLLVEEQRTNLLLRSEEFESASWTKSNTTVTANAGLSPDGTADADFLVENTATAAHDIYAGSTLTAASHTFSVYVKPNGRSWVNLFVFQSGGATNTVWFDISSGTIGTVAAGTTASITHSGNGWYRCSITFTALAAGASAYVRLSTGNNVATYTGDGTSGVFLWGAQVEVGSFATSYIPTAASQVTRASDNATITGANFSRWYNQSEGTFLVEADSRVDAATVVAYRAATVTDGTNSNLMGPFTYSGTWGGYVVVGGISQFNQQQSGSYTANVPAKIGQSYKANDFAISVNGNAALTDTSGLVPAVDRLTIGSLNGGALINGHIRRIKYYPTRLSNAQLQALTA